MNNQKSELEMTLRITAQSALDNAKKLDKFFLIAAYVYPNEWEVNFSENVAYNEILMAFVFCIIRITSELSESTKTAWLQYFISLFPQNEKQEDHLFKQPGIKLGSEADFALFVVDFAKGFCLLKSNCNGFILAQILYFSFLGQAAQQKKGVMLKDFLLKLDRVGLFPRFK